MLRSGVKVLAVTLLMILVSGYAPLSFAQTQNTGAIQGRVFEAGSLAPLAGAVVTITHEEMGLERTTVTDNNGIYFVGILPAGRYRISAALDGYQNDVDPENSVIRNFLIHITNTEKADQPPPIALRKIGTPAQPQPQPQPQPAPAQPTPAPAPRAAESEVSLLVNTSNGTRGGNFEARLLLALPLSGVRTFDDLAFLMPGVAPPPQHIGSTVGPGIGAGVGTSGQFSVNGLRSRANNFTIDGSDNNDEEVGVRRQGFTSLVPQSIESVQEFQITTLLAEPQFGRNMGAQVNAVSRSGGSGLHGTLYGFFTDSALRARDRFDFSGGPATYPLIANGQPVLLNGQPIAPANPVGGEDSYTRAQYGFVLGGPISRGKTFFFFSFEHQDINASRESHFAVPTVAQRGVFGRGAEGLTTVGGDPVFPTSLTGNAFFSLYPFPNNPVGPYGDNTFTEVLPAGADGAIFSGKLDHNFNAFGRSHSFVARYNFTDDNTILPVTGEALFSSLRALVRTQNVSLVLNSALSNRTANQLRVSYGRTSLGFNEVRDPFLISSGNFPNTPFLLNSPLLVNLTVPGGPPQFAQIPGLDSETSIGGINATGIVVATGTGPIGQVRVSGFSPLGVDVFNFPQGRHNNTFQYADTIILNFEKHRLTAGVDIRRSQLNSFLDRNFRPVADFSASADLSASQLSKLGTAPGFYLGSDFAAVGAPTGFFQTQALFPDSTIGLRYWQNDFFFADQIRVKPNFSLTLGLRYELNTVPTEVNNRIESTFGSADVQEFIDLETALFGRSGMEQFIAGRTKIFERDNNNVAPYVSFAWDPFGHGRTAIRGGYGIYYDQILGAVVSQSRNVFPTFLTVNLAGGFGNQTGERRLSAFNPTLIAAPGTLNTFRPDFGSPAIFVGAVGLGNNFASGAAFVLPAADLQTPYSQHWSLTIEHQFGKDFLLSAAYVGTRGSHLLRFATPNLGPNATPVVDFAIAETPSPNNPDLRFPAFFGGTVPPTAGVPGNDLRPFPLLGAFTSIESDANSNYHSLQLQANKRFSHGIMFTTAYTWSHAIDEVSDIFDLAGATALPQNSFDFRAEKASANFDVRHRFVYSLVWDLPFLEENRILGGWQLANVGTFQSGQPYTVLFCCDFNIDGNLTERPGLAIPGVGTGRNTFRAPGIATVDLAANKNFRFGERHRLEFRTEVFNLFNRTNFGVPVHQLFFASFEARPLNEEIFVDTRLPARTIQFALKFSF
jgi:hypothetical protein